MSFNNYLEAVVQQSKNNTIQTFELHTPIVIYKDIQKVLKAEGISFKDYTDEFLAKNYGGMLIRMAKSQLRGLAEKLTPIIEEYRKDFKNMDYIFIENHYDMGWHIRIPNDNDQLRFKEF